MAKVRKLSDEQFLQLLRIAAGLLQHTDGDLRQALAIAVGKHRSLIETIHRDGLVTDLGPGNAILFVPDEGGIALRLERHPRVEDQPTEEVGYPEVDLLGFEVIERGGQHQTAPRMDAGVIGGDEWE